MRIVAEKKPTEIIGASDVIQLGEKVDPAKVNREIIYLLICPRCRQRLQFVGSLLGRLIYQKTGRLLTL